MRGVPGADCDGRPFGVDELLQVYREEGGGKEATERTRTAIRSPRDTLAGCLGVGARISNATGVEVAVQTRAQVTQTGVQVVTPNRVEVGVEGGETPKEEIEP